VSIGRRFYTDITVSKYPQRSISVASSIDANLGVITFTLSSNLESGVVLNYALPNTATSDFVEGNSGNITVNGSGGATVVRTLNRYVNYSNTNVSSRLEITSPAGTNLVNSANFVIAPAVPFAATGGNITIVGANVVHTFTANSNLVVTNTGEVANEVVRSLLVAGGGAGNRATSFNEIILNAYNQWNRQSSGGGGGGGVLQPNVIASTYSVTTYPVTIGSGGRQPNIGENDSTRKGANTVAFGYTAIGGGGSSSGTQSFMNGGSGGGGSSNTQFGVGTVGQGNNGGTGAAYNTSIANVSTRISLYSGGGGGATTAGANIGSPGSHTQAGGSGGTGIVSDITGSNVTYAGGGGGGGYTAGLAGAGGGGNGGYFTNQSGATAPGQNGTNGLGGGGGGAGFSGANGSNTYDGGSGGSGVVVVAYRSQYRVLKPA